MEESSRLGGGAALEGEEDEVSAAADTEFIEQVGDVEFYCALGDVELARDFLVGEILEKGVEHFLFAAAQVGDRIRFEAAGLARKNGVHETGENGAWYPKAAGGDERQSADQLVASFGVREDPFYAEAEQREAGRVLVLFAYDDEASIGVAFENIGEQGAGGLAGRVRIDHVDLGFGRFE